jgi:hypothetical protein
MDWDRAISCHLWHFTKRTHTTKHRTITTIVTMKWILSLVIAASVTIRGSAFAPPAAALRVWQVSSSSGWIFGSRHCSSRRLTFLVPFFIFFFFARRLVVWRYTERCLGIITALVVAERKQGSLGPGRIVSGGMQSRGSRRTHSDTALATDGTVQTTGKSAKDDCRVGNGQHPERPAGRSSAGNRAGYLSHLPAR